MNRIFKKIIGWMILTGFFAGVFLATSLKFGYKEAAIMWVGAIILTALILYAVYLIVD